MVESLKYQLMGVNLFLRNISHGGKEARSIGLGHDPCSSMARGFKRDLTLYISFFCHIPDRCCENHFSLSFALKADKHVYVSADRVT